VVATRRHQKAADSLGRGQDDDAAWQDLALFLLILSTNFRVHGRPSLGSQLVGRSFLRRGPNPMSGYGDLAVLWEPLLGNIRFRRRKESKVKTLEIGTCSQQ
jgi:hypothetical protein